MKCDKFSMVYDIYNLINIIDPFKILIDDFVYS